MGNPAGFYPFIYEARRNETGINNPVLGLQVRVTELPLVSIITLAKGKGALGGVKQGFAGSSSEPEPRK